MTISGSSYSGSSNLLSSEVFDPRVDLSFVELPFANDSTIIHQNFSKANEISDFTFKWHHKVVLDSFNTFSFGTELKNINTNFMIDFPVDKDGEFVSSESGSVSSLYASNEFSKGKYSIVTGLRYNYIGHMDQHFVEPRLNFSYQPVKGLSLYGNYSFHRQFINRVSISPFGNSDQFYWVLGDDENYPILRSQHVTFGANYNYENWTFEIEAYRRRTSGLLESRFALKSQFNGLENSDDDQLLLPKGSNVTHGIDFFIKRKSRRYVTWLSYTMSNSVSQFDLLNNGLPFSGNFDQRHELNWVNIYKIGSWEFSSVFIYGSGRPYTSRGEVSNRKIILFDATNFNAFRLPDYHRLDLSVKYRTTIGKVNFESGVTFFNIYDRENVKSRRFSLRFNLNEQRDQITSLTAFPVETTLLGFTPNFFINLNF